MAQIDERVFESYVETMLLEKAGWKAGALAEWDEIVAGNPFRAEAARDPGHLVAMILKTAPVAAKVTALQAAAKAGPERVRASGAHLYIVYPEGIGRSKLTNVAIEKALAVRGTARNWNTVLKLQRAAQELSQS